jgi:hypothetical protein
MLYGSRASVKLTYALGVMCFREVNLCCRTMCFCEVSFCFVFQSDLMGLVTGFSASEFARSLHIWLLICSLSGVLKVQIVFLRCWLPDWGLGRLWHLSKSHRKPTQTHTLINQCSVKQTTVSKCIQQSNITKGMVDLYFKYMGTTVIHWCGIRD